MDDYQVWHQDGETFRKAAEVHIGNLQGAAILPALRVETWKDHPEIVPEPGEQRATGFGDIIIDPQGVEYRLEPVKVGGHDVPGFTEVTTIREQGYAEWVAEAELRHAAEGWEDAEIARFAESEFEADDDQLQSTPAELKALFRSWRDDASQRSLSEKGVDYSDAPYGEPTERPYEVALRAGIARAESQSRDTEPPQL